MKRPAQNNIIYSQDEPSQSDFVLDLRQQIETVKEKPIKVKPVKIKPVKVAKIKLNKSKSTPVVKKTVRPVKAKSVSKVRFKLIKPKTLKPVATLIGIFLLLILPFKLIAYFQDLQSMRVKVVSASSSGLNDLKSAGQLLANRDFLSASEKFDQASANFSQAREDLGDVQSWLWQLALVVPTSQTRLAASAPLIAQAGDLSGKLGNDLTILADNLNHGLAQQDLITTIRTVNQDSQRAYDDSRKLSLVIEKIDPVTLPQGYRQQLSN